MLTTKKQLQFIKTEDDKNYLECKCERIDKEIDQFTCRLVQRSYNEGGRFNAGRLYGLTVCLKSDKKKK